MELTFLKTFALLTLQILTKLPSLELISDIGFTKKKYIQTILKNINLKLDNYKLGGFFHSH